MRDRSPSHAMPSPQHPRTSTQPAASRDRTGLRNAEAGRLSGIGVTQKQSEHEEREDEDKGENNRTHGGASFPRPRKNQVHSESITEPAEGRILPRSSRYPYSRGANRGSVTLAGHIIRVCRSPLLHDGASAPSGQSPRYSVRKNSKIRHQFHRRSRESIGSAHIIERIVEPPRQLLLPINCQLQIGK